MIYVFDPLLIQYVIIKILISYEIKQNYVKINDNTYVHTRN